MINCVYIHIPFCKKKCNYCAFCSLPLLKYKDSYIEALIKEIKYFYKNEPLKTLYFGGGTPSLLEIEDFRKILECFNFSKKTELTLEANPYNLSFQKLQSLKNLGFNRLSLGVQSFCDKTLKIIGRNHTGLDAVNTFYNARRAGFNNINIDLIYGLPEQNLALWQKTLDKALEIKAEHISLYGLKIEKGTFFYKNPPKNLPSLDEQAVLYEEAVKKLKKEYYHYEFSNFAINKDYASRHNCSYWKRKNYWGFGLSASGFVENKRYNNTFNFKNYLIGPIKKEYQTLNKQEEIEEEIFLGLRLEEGLDFNLINKKYDIDIYNLYKQEFEKFIKEGFMEKTDRGVKLSLKGILVSNIILSEFIKI